MYAFATDGTQANNNDFSPCSRTMMDPVIAARGQTIRAGMTFLIITIYDKVQHRLNSVFYDWSEIQMGLYPIRLCDHIRDHFARVKCACFKGLHVSPQPNMRSCQALEFYRKLAMLQGTEQRELQIPSLGCYYM